MLFILIYYTPDDFEFCIVLALIRVHPRLWTPKAGPNSFLFSVIYDTLEATNPKTFR